MSRSFYGKIRAQGYDIGTDIQEIVDFYLAQWEKLGRPQPVLEPMCGTGLMLIPFLQAGADIDGSDLSPHMLAMCRQKLDSQGLDADLYEQPLETMALPGQYNFIFISDGSFGHITNKTSAQASLRRIWEHLFPGGWFIVDVKQRSQLSLFGQPGQADFEVEDHPDGATIFTTSVWGDIVDGCVIRNWNKYERYVEGKLTDIEIFDYRERLYERSEFEEMLTTAGFAGIIATKTYENVEPVENKGMVFICQRL